MKKIYYLFLFLFTATTVFSQGIAIQGIARDNAGSAITDTNLTFTFSITKSDNTVQYSETQAIKTDNFGIFSHIVSTGNPVTSAFNGVDFSIPDLKMKVLVNYNSSNIQVYDQTFQYTPYAHFAKKASVATNADNGAPTGSIMPYVGASAPAGWVLCDGQSIASLQGADALRALVGNNVPNLQGTFLRGTGVSSTNGKSGPVLRGFQNDAYESHLHNSGTLSNSSNGAHSHTYQSGAGSQAGIASSGWGAGQIGYTIVNNTSSGAPNHSHTISGSTGSTGDTETRPVNFGVNYIIKL